MFPCQSEWGGKWCGGPHCTQAWVLPETPGLAVRAGGWWLCGRLLQTRAAPAQGFRSSSVLLLCSLGRTVFPTAGRGCQALHP